MKYLTVTTPGYRSLTDQMIKSSGISDWDIRDMGEDTGDFRTPTFNALCRSKPSMILDLLLDGHEVFSLDGDVIFFDPITSIDLHDTADIQAQLDPDSGLCCGFCVYRPTKATIDVMRNMVSRCETTESNVNEQLILNFCLREYSRSNPITLAGLCSVHSYGIYSMETYGETRLWDGQEFALPANAKAFHANYTIGIETKVRLLDYVKEQRG